MFSYAYLLTANEVTPNGLSLSLLDFKVTVSKDGKSYFEFYKKSAKKALFVHHHSAVPKKSNINFIRNEWKRIQDRCFTQISTTKHQNAFNDILRQNRYPENSTDQTKRPQSLRRDSQPTNTEWSYLKLPYISERLNHGIPNIFRKENIPIRSAHRSHTLRRALSHNSTERTCTMDKSPISNTKLRLLRNAIYQITCNNCNEQYIGSTTRFIHNRIRGHLNNQNSSVKKHISSCQNKDYK